MGVKNPRPWYVAEATMAKRPRATPATMPAKIPRSSVNSRAARSAARLCLAERWSEAMPPPGARVSRVTRNGNLSAAAARFPSSSRIFLDEAAGIGQPRPIRRRDAVGVEERPREGPAPRRSWMNGVLFAIIIGVFAVLAMIVI